VAGLHATTLLPYTVLSGRFHHSIREKIKRSDREPLYFVAWVTSDVAAAVAPGVFPDSEEGLIAVARDPFGDDETLSASLRAGAAGFVLKDAPGEDPIKAVRTVASGDAWLDPTLTGRVLAAYRTQADTTPSRLQPQQKLTARELEVLALVGRRLTNQELAETLHISEVTVKTHLGHIPTKLDLRDRPAAIVYAFDAGLVTPR
jgi:DNA-binding CsgD family transcriptional regulator